MRIQGDYCLVSIGRSPYTAGLGLERVGITPDKRGYIPVNEHLVTSVPTLYAIGDVIGGAMLAHKAEEEGVFVAEHMSGQHPHIHYSLIPNVVYTWPEVAGVGYTEEQLKEKGIPYKAGSFPFRALGRAKASGDEEGLVKVLAHADSDEMLGMHVIGARAADLIAEGVVAMEYRASAEDIARMSHAPSHLRGGHQGGMSGSHCKARPTPVTTTTAAPRNTLSRAFILYRLVTS